VVLRITHEGDVVRVFLHGAPDADYGLCADRIGALGGLLWVEDEVVRAELPCGS
jgi:hypothetical protein